MDPTPQPDRGAVAIIVALCLLLLCGFAAIAVDSGLALDERRQEQAGVDSGVLSAGLAAQASPLQAGCGSGGVIQVASCNGAVVAMTIINTNADAPYPMSAFDNPVRCADAAFPAEFRTSGSGVISQVSDAGTPRTLECIRWTENLSKVRVILPVTAVNTTFGRVLGRNSIDVAAFAEAETLIRRPGQVIPFVVGPTGADANLGCLYEPPPGQVPPPCAGPDDGNFGYMEPRLYGDRILNTPQICTANQDNIAASLAKGADHTYALNPTVPGIANDIAHCPNKNQLIDEIDVRTGGAKNPITQGAIESIYGTEGRLRCKDGDAGEPTWMEPALSSATCLDVDNSLAETLDNTPLWSFIDPGAASESFGACNSGVNNRVGMLACLAGWRAFGSHTLRLFTPALATSPRFAWVPRVNADPGTGGSGFYTIEDFLPVYIQTMMFGCTGGGCSAHFDPGESSVGACVPAPTTSCGFPWPGNKDLDAMAAFNLRKDMLPTPLDLFPGTPGQNVFNLSE